MKVGLLADIHGNADALESVLASAMRLGVARLLIAGDLVGYYYEADRVLAQLTHWKWVAVKGSHEKMLSDWLSDIGRERILRTYGSGISEACVRLSTDQLTMLTSLSHPLRLNIDGKDILLCHGTPYDADVYVYPDAPSQMRETFIEDTADLVIFGHTHYPVVWRTQQTVVVNPGSVGQPRDRIPGACWAVWNSEYHTIEFLRETYDPSAILSSCCNRDPHLPYLADVLTRTGD